MNLLLIIIGMINLLVGIGFTSKQINDAGSFKQWSDDGLNVCYPLFVVMTTFLIWTLPFYVF